MADYPDWTDWAQIVGTDVKVAVDIQGGYIMLPVDIQAQNITLEIDITAQTVGNITIDIAAQTVGNLAVNIAASAVTLNVNIAASAVTITVSVTGTAQVDIETQSVGIFLQQDWSAVQGTDKNYASALTNKTWAQTLAVSYLVPGGKTLYVCGVSCVSNAVAQADYDHHLYVLLALYQEAPLVEWAFLGGLGGCCIVFSKPIAIVAGKTVYFQVSNMADIECEMGVTGWGYEI